jgi:lambda repressor-like predicted transcriptional regulator
MFKLSTKKQKAFKLLIKDGYLFQPTLLFLLTECGQSIQALSGRCNCSTSHIYNVISGKRKSKTVQEEIARVLGFNPWEIKS